MIYLVYVTTRSTAEKIQCLLVSLLGPVLEVYTDNNARKTGTLYTLKGVDPAHILHKTMFRYQKKEDENDSVIKNLQKEVQKLKDQLDIEKSLHQLLFKTCLKVNEVVRSKVEQNYAKYTEFPKSLECLSLQDRVEDAPPLRSVQKDICQQGRL